MKKRFNKIVWKLLPSCKDITALVSRSLENDLSRREKLVMKTHLYTCIACRRFLTQLKFMSEVFVKQEEKLENGEFARRLSSDAAERLKNALGSSNMLILYVLISCY